MVDISTVVVVLTNYDNMRNKKMIYEEMKIITKDYSLFPDERIKQLQQMILVVFGSLIWLGTST